MEWNGLLLNRQHCCQRYFEICGREDLDRVHSPLSNVILSLPGSEQNRQNASRELLAGNAGDFSAVVVSGSS